ncbi:uncharacterized protein LOC111052137 [Nilaparvata lugens]|uniref:uncharacterized protein LOC111052137 n=1 Tax=Nilaparvata lugens TaxID=108931 RepID=UPI00193CEB40|nr:uncharacterized protein LOC111052137 [Nilaparvata lugens]
MSADSPRRLSRKGSTGHVVLPQPVSDPSIIDSVAGFIHEVIPQAYSSVLPGDSRESVVRARFEQADYNDPSLYPEAGEDCDSTPPLLLVLGYSNGVQVWSIGSSGEAVEVLSWNQRVVRTLRFLPSPHSSASTTSSSSSPLSDPFAHKRPLIALVDNSGPPPHFSTCSFISLQAGDQVKSIKFKNPICDVLANRRSIVVTFVERIAVFDAATLEDRLTITTCYPSPGVCPNPVALGPRWLAFADKRLVSWWRSVGGSDEGGAHGSYTASVLHAAMSLGKGLRGLSAHLTQTTSASASASSPTLVNGTDANATPGVVTVIDIQGNSWQNGGGGAGALGENIVAHFVAHHMEPLVALAFDPSGMLLLTVDKRGHRFHLFRIQPHLSGSSMSEVHQLYTLYRSVSNKLSQTSWPANFAYSSVLPGDSRESVVRARFEQADYNDPSLYPEAGEDCDSTPPLLLVLGYSNGVQILFVQCGALGRVEKRLKFSHGINALCAHSAFSPLLTPPPTPPPPLPPLSDPFAHKRPLIALVDNSGPPPHFSTCSFISLQAGDQRCQIVLANRCLNVVQFGERIALFDAATVSRRGNTKTIASQNETIKYLRSENVELKHKVIKLSSEFDDLEQYSRRECIEINGVPEAINENLQKLFQDVGKAIKFKKGYEAVSCCHRLKKRNNQATPGIIVKFTRREDAEDFIQLKKDKGVLTTRDIGLTGANHIFINASLTAKRRVLFGKARQLVKAAKIKYLWVDRAGRIKARVVDGGPVSKTIASQNETIKCLRSENVELKHKVIKLSSEFDDLEQYSRRECIEINGVPEAINENLQKLFQDVGKAIKFKKGYEAVSCCHRLKKRNNQATPGIIVKFTRREDAEDFIQLKKDKGVLTTRDIGLTGANHIFINASLTAKRRVLFGKARQLVKAAKIKYLWVDRAGRIKARVVDGGPVSIYRKIDCHNDSVLLQSDLDFVSGWCTDNGLDLNVGKCKFMVFTQNRIVLVLWGFQLVCCAACLALRLWHPDGRWLAFADKRLVSWWRSVGGSDEGGAHGSYTASVLHAAMSLGKGLRGLSAHLTQTTSASASASSPTLVNGTDANATPGVVTVIDIQGNSWQNGGGGAGALGENIVAHFVAHHMEPLVALAFDPSGMLLLTVDKRGHRFHLFRIQPHLSGSSMSEVHQLYTLYRGDTTARIQDVAFSCDSRWVSVSSMRGTTHIFPITPYGGSIGVRTHTTPHVVNKLSRFHRSAGLSERRDGGGRNSPVGSGHHSDAGGGATPGVAPPLTPPLSQRSLHQHPHSPVVVQPLAQLKRHQPMPSPAQTAQGSPTASGDCEAAQVRVAACFGVARAALPPGLLQTGSGGQYGGVGGGGGGGVGGSGGGVMTSQQRKSDSSIYVMSAPSGALLQYDLEPRHIAGLSKDRVSDDTAIELLVDAKAEWLVMWPPLFNPVQPPLAASSPLLQGANCPLLQGGSNRPHNHAKPNPHHDEHWLSQVEIVTHADPHRRLWMGPQFTFKTYSLSSRWRSMPKHQ